MAQACEVKLKALDEATAMANAMTFCPFLQQIYHSPTEGCMGAPEAQCCCCEKETFVDPLNLLMKQTEELTPLWAFNPGCKDAPLQCSPDIDCDACQGGKKCQANPTEAELEGIDLSKTTCENTESASSCDAFACEAGFEKQGSATCMNGNWDLSNAKCLKSCAQDPAFDHVDNAKSTCEGTLHGGKCVFSCEVGYSPSTEDAQVTCNDGQWTHGPLCMKDDWCKLKALPTTRIKNYRLKPKAPRSDWDRGKELVARRNFRCARGARIHYEIPKEKLDVWSAALNVKSQGHADAYNPNYPPSPVDLCEEACRDVTAWKPEATKFQARGFSLYWSQRPKKELEDDYGEEAHAKFKVWRGQLPPSQDAAVCFCEAGDAKTCAAEQHTQTHTKEGLYWRYDFEFDKENAPAKIAFKTSYAWNELRDPDGPFETPDWFETPILRTDDKIFGPEHKGIDECDNNNKNDPCIDKHPDGFNETVLTKRSCTPSSPCGVCRGDCNSDDDCAGHLRCWQRSDNAMIRPEIDRLVRPGPVVNGNLLYADRVPGCRSTEHSDGGIKNLAYTCKDSKRSPHKMSCGEFANTDGTTDVETESSRHDLHMDYCYDPNLLSAKCKAGPPPPESIVSGELTGGQTCKLQEAIVVPACTELTLQGVPGPNDNLANAPAVISGDDKTNHFNVNGKLTLKNLILERGLAFDYRGGSLHVSGFEALVHLIGTTIQGCSTTADSGRAIHGYGRDSVKVMGNEGGRGSIAGGAIFLTPGDVEPKRGHNDGVRLILEASTITGNFAETAGGAIFSRGSTIEVREGTSVIRGNVAFPTFDTLFSGDSQGNGGGIFMKLTGGLIVRGPESVLWMDSNEAFYGGGGISLQGWFPEISDRPEGWQSPEVVVEGGGVLKFTNNRAVIFGGAMQTEAQRSYHDNPNDRFSVPALDDLCKLSETIQLRVRGHGSSLVVHNNSATIGGGLCGLSVNSVGYPEVAHCSHKDRNHGSWTFESGSRSFFTDNQALPFDQQPQLARALIDAVLADDSTAMSGFASSNEVHGGSIGSVNHNIYIKGTGTLVDVTRSSAYISGGGFMGKENFLELSGAATFALHGNQAGLSGGGVGLLIESTCIMRDAASTLKVSDNRAEYGGGILIQYNGNMFLYDGAAVNASRNSAAKNGGGLTLMTGSSLISDIHSSAMFYNNIARGRDDGGGGAISMPPGTVLRLDGMSEFFSNIAEQSNGGGISAHPSGKDDGSGVCVDIKMIMLQPGSTEPLRNSKLPDGTSIAKREHSTVKVSPRVAQLEGRIETSRKEGFFYNNSAVAADGNELNPLSACVPCGVYEATFVPVKWIMPYTAGTRIIVTHTTPDGREITFSNSDVPGRTTLSVVTFNVGCEWAGISLNRARFQNNTAVRGGAISIESRKNILLGVRNSTFTQNVAVGARGGAVQVSGTGNGAHFSSGCAFHGNSVMSGSGGAISIESSASLFVSETTGSGNVAKDIRTGGGEGKGGFVYASFASPIFMRDVDVRNGKAVDGGAFSVIASKIAFDSVSVENCTAGATGGAMRLDQGAEGHVFGSVFKRNSAGSSGGHVEVSASSLVVHGKHSSMSWFLEKPVRASTSALPQFGMVAPLIVAGAKQYVRFSSGEDCVHQVAGLYRYERILSIEECREAAFLLGSKNQTGSTRSSTYSRSRLSSLDPRCYVELQAVDQTSELRYDNTFRYLEVESDAWRHCSTTRICVCRRVPVSSSTSNHPRGSIFENGKSGKSGGSLNCASSRSFSVVSAGCSRSDALPFREFASRQDLNTFDNRVCFQGGIRIGNGTNINGSVSKAGGGAISATSCRVEVDGVKFVDNRDMSTFGGGAVHLGPGTDYVANAASFQQNLATVGPGGALSCIACSGLTLTGGTTFLNNEASQSGGAIFAENAPHQEGMLSSSQSHFEGNTAKSGDGGAVYESSNIDTDIGHWKSTGDHYVNNVAESGSGGALAMIRTRAELNTDSLCAGNRAPLGGGGCIYWEPQLNDTNAELWAELAPQHNDSLFRGARTNAAAFGRDLATGGKYLDHDHNLLTVSAQDKTFPLSAFPVLLLRDNYGAQIIRKNGLTGNLKDSVLVAALQETETKSNLGGATGETLSGPRGNATFTSLLLTELPNSGPHDISFKATLNVGNGLTRVVKTRQNVQVKVGKCPKKGIKDCACPRGQVKVGHRCLCDGAAIIKQVAALGLGKHQETMPIHYFPEDKTAYLIGYFNASNTSAAGKETCPNREDQDDFGFCCVPCLNGADCTPCANQTVQTITKEEIEAGRITPKCTDSDQKYSLENDELTPLPGYWKAKPSSSDFMDCAKAFLVNDADATVLLAKTRCCPLVPTNGNVSASVCKLLGANITDPSWQCLNSPVLKEAYEGPSCKVCRVDYTFDANANACVACPGGASIGRVFGGMFVVLAAIWIVLAYVFWKADILKDEEKKNKNSCCRKKKHEGEIGQGNVDNNKDADDAKEKTHIEEQRKKGATQRFLADQALTGRVQGSSASGVASSSDASRNDIRVITDRVKVFYGWLQIFSSLTFTFSGVPWPSQLWSMSNFFSFVNFDPSGLFPKVAGCSLAVDFTDKLIVHLCFPVLLLVTIFIARIPAFLLKRSVTQKRKQKQLTYKLITSLSLIMYPGICTRIFSGMRTIHIAGLGSASHSGEVLQMDYSIEVDGATHSSLKAITAVGIILYVAGIPIGVAMALKSNSKFLYNNNPEVRDKHEACVSEFGNLYMQ